MDRQRRMQLRDDVVQIPAQHLAYQREIPCAAKGSHAAQQVLGFIRQLRQLLQRQIGESFAVIARTNGRKIILPPALMTIMVDQAIVNQPPGKRLHRERIATGHQMDPFCQIGDIGFSRVQHRRQPARDCPRGERLRYAVHHPAGGTVQAR